MKTVPKTRVRTRATVTSKGQITIPIAIRRRGRAYAGAQFDVNEDERGIHLTPVSKENPFLKYARIGNPGMPTGREALVKWFREWRGHDDFD